MKIAMVIGNSPFGSCGVGDYARHLASTLCAAGHEVELVDDGTFRLRDAGKQWKRIRDIGADVIHIQYPTLGFAKRLGPQALAACPNVLLTLHEFSRVHILRKLSLVPFACRVRHVIFTSPFERKIALAWAPWLVSRSSVIPLGSTFAPTEHAGPKKWHEIVYFGLIRPDKGIEDVIELARLIQASGEPYRVRVIGRPHADHASYFDSLRHSSADLPVDWDCDLSDAELNCALSQAAIAYLPFPDGISDRRSTVKALLANGAAIITTKGAQTPTDILNVVTTCSSPRAALDAAVRLMRDSDEQKKVRSLALQYMERFSWQRIAAQHIRVYEEIWGGQRDASPAFSQ